ncbi:hypothetical protein MY7_1312 [Bacillus sp. 5B6]|nr:hypothetical protein MY7_1312 [Bacillus sp. 5B6]
MYIYLLYHRASGLALASFQNPYIRRETFLFPFIHGILLLMLDTMEDYK